MNIRFPGTFHCFGAGFILPIMFAIDKTHNGIVPGSLALYFWQLLVLNIFKNNICRLHGTHLDGRLWIVSNIVSSSWFPVPSLKYRGSGFGIVLGALIHDGRNGTGESRRRYGSRFRDRAGRRA